MSKKDIEAQNALLSVVGQRQFFLMSDGGHDGLSNERLFSQQGFIQGLASQGVKHIFLEVDAAHQPDVEEFYNGRISAQELSSRIGVAAALDPNERQQQKVLEAQFFEHARNAGIRIHFVDPKNQVDSIYPDRAHVNALIREGVARGEVTTDEQAGEIAKKYNLTLADIHEYSDLLLQERSAHDQTVAQTIRQLAGHDRAVVVYGSLHLAPGEEHLPAQLGRDKSLVAFMQTPDSVGQISPDYVLNTSEMSFERTLRGVWRGAPSPDSSAQIVPAPAPTPTSSANVQNLPGVVPVVP